MEPAGERRAGAEVEPQVRGPGGARPAPRPTSLGWKLLWVGLVLAGLLWLTIHQSF